MKGELHTLGAQMQKAAKLSSSGYNHKHCGMTRLCRVKRHTGVCNHGQEWPDIIGSISNIKMTYKEQHTNKKWIAHDHKII